MSKGTKSSGTGSSGSLIAGIMLGMVLGLAAAGGVAWYIIKKNPASFENKEHKESPKPGQENNGMSNQPSAPTPAAASSPAATSGVTATVPKQHFEFYKVLTDKPESNQKNTDKSAASTKETHSEPPKKQTKPLPPSNATKEIFYVQAGSFPNEDDAEKLKAKLALLGLEASLQTAVIPDRGIFHRVRLGPFNTNNETNKTLETLKQNGIANATPIKVQ
jgi:cell division protein FtsN